MFTQQDFPTWLELEQYVRTLQAATSKPEDSTPGFHSPLLYRGQASHGWSLETTLHRSAPTLTGLSDYYRLAAVAKTQVESFTSRNWPTIDYVEAEELLSRYDTLRNGPLPHYEYLVYLRHHGFPSPLLDWSRSLYVAAFFAFQKPQAEQVAIFVYQEFAGFGKASSSGQAQIHTLGPNIRTHQRHFLQQAEYTTALHFRDGAWRLANHMDVFLGGREEQDHLWKLTAPAAEARLVMQELEQFNINAFSLFQTEDALLATIASRLISHGPYGAP